MPRCQDRWVRRDPAQVTVKVTKPAHGDLYSLTYATGPKVGGPLKPLDTGTFDSAALANGTATWRVPYDHTSIFTLQTSGTGVLQTTVEIDDVPVHQGACQAQGSAGLAGYWRVTIWAQTGGAT